MIRILASASPGEVRIALCDGDTLQDYAIWRPGAPDGLGDILAGRVITRVPAMAGSFVALPGAEGFLPDSEGAPFTEGTLLKVRVVRSAQGGKGPRLALEGDGRLAPGTTPGLLRRGDSPLHRLASRFPDAPIEIDDAGLAARLRPAFAGRLALVARSFPEPLEAEIEALGETWADLPGGLRAGVFPTPALTAIDLDGGSSSSARAEKSAQQFAANRAALPGLARQIRLRNLSGIILIDFAGLPARRRAALGPDLALALASDPMRPRLLGFTGMGLAEILRPRGTAPLHELLAGPHAAGLAALRHLARAPGPKPRLRASAEVVAALQGDAVALADFARVSAYPLLLETDEGRERDVLF